MARGDKVVCKRPVHVTAVLLHRTLLRVENLIAAREEEPLQPEGVEAR